MGCGESAFTLQVRDLATGRVLSSREFPAVKESDGHDYAWLSRDGHRLATATPDGHHTVWDAATGREVASFRGPSRSVGLVFAPDGHRLATGHRDGTLRLWDAETGRELLSLKGHASFIGPVAFSPDGNRLASAGGDRTVKLWDAETGRGLFTLRGHTGSVLGVAFSPDGRRLASAGDDRTVKLWDTATGQLLSLLEGRGAGLAFVEFSPDGRRLAACAQRDGSVKVWEADIPPEDLERRAAESIVSDLFHQLGLRTDVLERLEVTPDLSPLRRRVALAAARVHPEDASALNALAWELIKSPDRDRADYRRALRCAEQAGQLDPGKAAFVTTLGVAYYRAGNHEKAVETLERSNRVRSSHGGGASTADLAFLAMAQRRLGRTPEARASLDRLRESLKDPSRVQGRRGPELPARGRIAGGRRRAPAGP